MPNTPPKYLLSRSCAQFEGVEHVGANRRGGGGRCLWLTEGSCDWSQGLEMPTWLMMVFTSSEQANTPPSR